MGRMTSHEMENNTCSKPPTSETSAEIARDCHWEPIQVDDVPGFFSGIILGLTNIDVENPWIHARKRI